MSIALIGEIAVWRAANGINRQDPRPTGGTQLETLPALWKQRLDRDIAHATYPPAAARADERQAAHTGPRRLHDQRQRRYQETRTASEQALRARPVAHLSHQIVALGT